MVEFTDLVNYLKKNFDSKTKPEAEMGSESDDININFGIGMRYRRPNSDKNLTCTIKSNDLMTLFKKVNAMSYDDIHLYTKNSFEVALNADSIRTFRLFEEPLPPVDDFTNGVTYTLNFPSVEYSMFVLMNIIKLRKENLKNTIAFSRRFRRVVDYPYGEDTIPNLTIDDILPVLISEITLKITSIEMKTLEEFQKLSTSFIFEFMYRKGISLVNYRNIIEMYSQKSLTSKEIKNDDINKPPLRSYNDDVVDYYKLALSSSDPFIQYVSFYHIMEYFYDEVFRRKLIEDMRDKITHPSFSYKDEDKLYDIATFIKNRMKMNEQDGQGNELESLKFVLSEYVDIEELKVRINELDSESSEYYQNTKVPFCKASALSWNDTEGICTLLAKRVYNTRNALVHSKSGKNNERYRPYKNEQELKKEIPLVQAIAELIIINSAKKI